MKQHFCTLYSRKAGERMKANIIESYIEKVYGYAVNRTYSREEADELAQEILFTAVRELPKLKDDSKFEQWLWLQEMIAESCLLLFQLSQRYSTKNSFSLLKMLLILPLICIPTRLLHMLTDIKSCFLHILKMILPVRVIICF